MRRRDFLKALGAAAVAPGLTLYPAKEPVDVFVWDSMGSVGGPTHYKVWLQTEIVMDHVREIFRRNMQGCIFDCEQAPFPRIEIPPLEMVGGDQLDRSVSARPDILGF